MFSPERVDRHLVSGTVDLVRFEQHMSTCLLPAVVSRPVLFSTPLQRFLDLSHPVRPGDRLCPGQQCVSWVLRPWCRV